MATFPDSFWAPSSNSNSNHGQHFAQYYSIHCIFGKLSFILFGLTDGPAFGCISFICYDGNSHYDGGNSNNNVNDADGSGEGDFRRTDDRGKWKWQRQGRDKKPTLLSLSSTQPRNHCCSSEWHTRDQKQIMVYGSVINSTVSLLYYSTLKINESAEIRIWINWA